MVSVNVVGYRHMVWGIRIWCGVSAYFVVYRFRAHWGMGLIFHQAKPRWTRREEDSKSSVLDMCLGMRR